MTDIKKLQELIDNSNNIIFFGGAGVSTESGIKDFRGKNGLYKEKNTEYSPEYMLSSRCLYKDTEMFYKYYNLLYRFHLAFLDTSRSRLYISHFDAFRIELMC